MDTAVVTVGSVRAGTKENIIPGEAELRLSIRTFDPQVRDTVLSAVTRIVDGEAAASGAPERPEITSVYSFQRVENDEEATERVAAAHTRLLGADRVREVPAFTGSEDFGAFGRRGSFPSVFWWIGGTDPDGDQSKDANEIYLKLERIILPLYYGLPFAYAEVMRSAIALNGSFFNTQRMVEQYIRNAYFPEEAPALVTTPSAS